MYPQLVVTRKLNHPELVFNENLLLSDEIRKKHLDFSAANGDWQVTTRNDECYYCSMHPYVQIYFRRTEA